MLSPVSVSPLSGGPVIVGISSGLSSVGGVEVLLVLSPLPALLPSEGNGFAATIVTVRFCGIAVLFARSDTVYVNTYVAVVFVSILIILMPFCSDMVNVVLPVIST